ncbi:MAG: hypothetical protein K6E94_04425 [Elusimicrobiaceae bacterium]|nr:hypothetical protein [Elusimicrobiaceae bacterium]
MSEINNTNNNVFENNVGPISIAIEKITSLRTRHLPVIQAKEKLLKELTEAINTFTEWQEDVRNKQLDSELNNLMQKVPELSEIANYDIKKLRDYLDSFSKQIALLRKRFERKNVQISLVGRARHGKSCILQAVTGLNDDTIPTSSETDCTGAVSIIYNWDKKDQFEMDVDYYTPEEFIDAVNAKLTYFFGEGHPYRVHTLEQIASLPKSAFNSSVPEQEGFYNDYVSRFHQYVDCFGATAVRHFESTENVVEYVAKYKVFTSESDIPTKYRQKGYFIEKREQEVSGKTIIDFKVHFANFVTIKKAVMSTHYPNADTTKIVAVDTIGLGNALTSETDRNNMFKVLREDTDMAIFTYKIIPGSESELPKFITDSLDEIFGELSGMFPDLWVTCLLNEYGSGAPVFMGRPTDYASYKNVVNQIYEKVASTGFGKNVQDKKLLTICKTINALDKEEVNSQFILPALQQITQKLPDIDSAMANAANETGKTLSEEIHSLCEKLAAIKSKVAELNPNRYKQFKNNFKALQLRDRLSQLCEELRMERDKGNPTISSDLKAQLDNIEESIPDTEKMESTLNSMVSWAPQQGVATIILNVYANILKGMKTVSSKSISTIQLNVQNQVASILFEYGLWDRLSLVGVADDTQPIERLKAFSEQKLSLYPSLQQIIQSILDFRMNIEGLLYSSCILQCESLKDYPDVDIHMSKSEVIAATNEFLQVKVPAIKKQLEYDFGIKKDVLGTKKTNLTLKMPNLLVWCMVDTFYQELASEECQSELESFYMEYQDTIWADQNKTQSGMADVVTKYMQTLQCIHGFDSSDSFKVVIKKES